MHVYVCLLVLGTQYIHVYMISVHVQVYVCGVPNIKLVSLQCMPNEPFSTKCEKGICSVSMCVCMHHICLCVPKYTNCVYVCAQHTHNTGIFGMYAK